MAFQNLVGRPFEAVFVGLERPTFFAIPVLTRPLLIRESQIGR